MIRHFTNLCKAILDSLFDEAIFQNATNEFQCRSKKCPCCGATGKLSPYGDYTRNLASFIGGKVVSSIVTPLRFLCASCGTTHALLPDITIPYSPYSIHFMITVLLAYFERDTPVTVLCAGFGIAVSTLYEWKKRLVEHKDILLGVLAGNKTPALAFLRYLIKSVSISDILSGFFSRHAFSFMQSRSAAAARYIPP